MRVALITVGDTGRLTGGYLYQARVIAGLREHGFIVDEIVASGVQFDEQLRAAGAFVAQFTPEAYDAIIVDALARGVCAPGVDRWRSTRPVAILVHQLPSVAENEPPHPRGTRDHRPQEPVSKPDHDQHVALSDERECEWMCEAALLRAEKLIAVSEHGRELLIERGVERERTVIIPPGFDRLGGMSSAPLAKAPTNQLVALCVAQWIPRKGITTLVRAWQSASPSQATLVLIGETHADPIYQAKVRKAIVAHPDGIEVRGQVSDIELTEAYRSADLFVLPTRFEGYGMVYAEALSYGLPVIASNVGPIPRLVTETAGRFVPPDDELALAGELTRMLRDEDLRQKLSAGARRRATMLPTWADTVDGFIDVLNELRRRAS